MSAEIATEHPHVVRQPGICRGAPVVRGTRIPVRLIAELWTGGETVDDIVHTYAHLQPSWIYDAISYYLDHRTDIDAEMEVSRIDKVLAEHAAVMEENGLIRLPPGNAADGQ